MKQCWPIFETSVNSESNTRRTCGNKTNDRHGYDHREFWQLQKLNPDGLQNEMKSVFPMCHVGFLPEQAN